MSPLDMEELVIGVKKARMSELKELKVKVPVRLLVNLHYLKITQSRKISDVVDEALTKYFSDGEKSDGEPSAEPESAGVSGDALTHPPLPEPPKDG